MPHLLHAFARTITEAKDGLTSYGANTKADQLQPPIYIRGGGGLGARGLFEKRPERGATRTWNGNRGDEKTPGHGCRLTPAPRVQLGNGVYDRANRNSQKW